MNGLSRFCSIQLGSSLSKVSAMISNNLASLPVPEHARRLLRPDGVFGPAERRPVVGLGGCRVPQHAVVLLQGEGSLGHIGPLSAPPIGLKHIVFIHIMSTALQRARGPSGGYHILYNPSG